MSFRSFSLSPAAWMTLDRVTQQVIWLILFAILAPILGPRPYGLFAIVMVFIGFCEFILSEGTIEALITVDELHHLHIATANFAYGGAALALALVMFLFAPLLGTAFHDDEIKRLFWTLAPLPVLSALTATPIAVLRRDLKYKQLALRSIAGLALGGAVGIALAVAGAGVWALAFQALLQRVAEFVIVWISVPVRLRFRWSSTHFRDLNSVGMNVFTARTMGFVGGQLPRVILGYTLGPIDVGLFTLSSRFLDIIIQTTVSTRTAVGRIEMREAKPGSAEFTQIFSKMVQNTSILAFPLFLGAAALAPDLFGIWLDHRWAAGVVPTQLLLISGLPLVLFYCVDSALLAANLSDIFKWVAIVNSITMAITVLCIARYGLNSTCFSLMMRSWILCPIVLFWFGRACHTPVYRALRAPLWALVGAIVMAALLTLSVLRPSWLYRSVDFIFLVLGGMMIYITYLYCFARHQLRELFADIVFRKPRELVSEVGFQDESPGR